MSMTSAENQGFISEVGLCFKVKIIIHWNFVILQVANQVMAGEGVGWLRVGRLKKLLEDESYRVMLVVKINKTFERKVGPDDHVDDVVRIFFINFEMMELRFFFIPVHYETSLERNAEIASAPRQRFGTQFCKSWFGWNGFCLSGNFIF